MQPRPNFRGKLCTAAISMLTSLPLLAGLLGGVAFAAPSTLITEVPCEINKPGRYKLAGNLSYGGYAAIKITANNVDLNGAGSTLTGTGGFAGILAESVSGVRIHNVSVTGFQVGIYVLGGSNNALVGNTASSATWGIVVRSSNNDVTGNTANNSYLGIVVDGHNNALIGNTASYHASAGILLGTGSTGNLVRGNSTLSNSGAGIWASLGSLGNHIQGNTTHSNTVADLYDVSGDCVANTWVGNTFDSASPKCIE